MKRTRSRYFYPLFVSAVLFALYYTALKSFDPDLEQVFGQNFHGLLFAAFIPLVLLAGRLIDAVVFDLFLSQQRRKAAPRLLRDVVALIIYFILFSIAAVRIFGSSFTSLFTAGTVVAAILGLALQETLGNLFSGIALHMEDSFAVGDVVKSGDAIGVVQGVTWRATRLRAFNNNVIILPNSIIARDRLEVFPRDHLNARVLQIGVDYNVPPATVINVLTQAAAHVDGVTREMPCLARVGAFGDSAVVYEVKYFTRDYSARDRIDADVRKAVWYALRRNNISIPFPIRSIQQYEAPRHDQHDVGTEDVRRRLQRVDFLEPLPEPAQEALVEAARVCFYSRGETIIRIGSAGESMFIVHDGTVSVRIPDDTAAGRHEVAQLGPGSVFGEMALLTGEARTANVIALTDVTAIEITKSALQPILQSHPEIMRVISSKVTERRLRLSELKAADVEEEEMTLVTRIRSYFGL